MSWFLCVVRLSATKFLIMQNKRVIVFHKVGFWLPLPSQCWEMIENANIFSCLARWLTSARAYRIGGRKLCPSVCLYVKRYLLLQFCTDYNQTWINMIWAVAAKTLLSQIFHKWRKIEVNCVYISRCAQLVSYFWNAGMHTNRRYCAGQCAGQ